MSSLQNYPDYSRNLLGRLLVQLGHVKPMVEQITEVLPL